MENELDYHKKDDVSQMLRNSTHQEIRICGKNLHIINELLKQTKFIHKTTEYKRFDRQLFKLMVKLDDIDVEENHEYIEQRKLALMKIHDMNKLLDSKVKCKLDHCIICKTGIDLK
jgi:hypothetical protein